MYIYLRKDGVSPLHLASLLGGFSIVEALLARGADVNIQDDVSAYLYYDAAAF